MVPSGVQPQEGDFDGTLLRSWKFHDDVGTTCCQSCSLFSECWSLSVPPTPPHHFPVHHCGLVFPSIFVIVCRGQMSRVCWALWFFLTAWYQRRPLEAGPLARTSAFFISLPLPNTLTLADAHTLRVFTWHACSCVCWFFPLATLHFWLRFKTQLIHYFFRD